MRSRFLRVAAMLSLVSVGPAAASRLIDAPIDQLTRNASVILEGDVAAVRSEWNADRTRIYTTVSIRVSAYHKGSLASNLVDLRVLGGSVDEITMAVTTQPSFEANERVFLFLKPNFERRDTPIVGDALGKMRVTTDAAGADILLGHAATYEKVEVVREIRSVLRPIGQ